MSESLIEKINTLKNTTKATLLNGCVKTIVLSNNNMDYNILSKV